MTDEELEDFYQATGQRMTAAEAREADRAVAEDQAELQTAYAEREKGGVEYTPPTAKDVKAYSTAETKVYSRVLSRKVYFYDGASHARAEAGVSVVYNKIARRIIYGDDDRKGI